MVTSRRSRLVVAAGAGGLLALALGAGASAHVSIAESEAVAGSYTLLTFGVPHGCDDSPTTRVRIAMPESIPQVTPTVNPGWRVEKVTEVLDEPIEAGHGEQITERVAEVVYTAARPLPADLRDAFVLSVRIPDDAAGETLHFPTVQECEAGETAWIDVPQAGQDGEELETPAPSIAVVAAEGSGHPAGDGTGDEAGADDAVQGAGLRTEGAAAVDDDGDGAALGFAIAGLVAGVAGLGLGGVALARSRRS